MTDHQVGLLGLALAVISIIAPLRWPKMHRVLTDIGLGIGCVLIGVAFAPDLEERLEKPSRPEIPIPVPQPTSQLKVKVAPTRSAADQKIIDSLQVDLEATKKNLAEIQEIIKREADETHENLVCITSDRLKELISEIRKMNDLDAKKVIDLQAKYLDICNKGVSMSRNQVNEELYKTLRGGKL